jgi:hypothetical protein
MYRRGREVAPPVTRLLHPLGGGMDPKINRTFYQAQVVMGNLMVSNNGFDRSGGKMSPLYFFSQ